MVANGTAGTLVLSASMESAGSGWLFNLTNEMLKSVGHSDVRLIREQYGLDDVLLWDNCNVGELDEAKWRRLQPAIADGHTFVVKTHRKPTPMVRQLCSEGLLKATYIYRDPRDVVVSAYRRGQVRRANGHRDSFARLRTIDIATVWMRYRQMPVYEAWLDQPNTQLVRYEDLSNDGIGVLRLLAQHLGVAPTDTDLERLVSDYHGGNARQKAGTHFIQGGRRREEMTPGQLRRCNWLCGSTITRMGYEP
ncbi:MAG: sulfotransferase domain-containing protein [Solirubrobacterales bacterium]